MAIGAPPEVASQAIMAFNGDVYLGLDAPSLSEDDLAFSQDHLRVLSGLYGLLRPLDRMQPYRLEMGSPLSTRRGPTLYAYWGARITKAIDAATEGHADRTVVNLASNEYFKAVMPKKLAAKVVTPVFQELHNGALKVISFNAKKTRGLMARWILQNRIDAPDVIREFSEERYAFREDLSTPTQPVFTRVFVSVAQ